MKQSLLLLIFISVTQIASAQTKTKVDNIRQLLELTGSGKLGMQAATTMIDNFKKNYPDVDESYWIEIRKEITADELINMVVPIYDKYFSDNEIKELIAFYNSAVGKKVIENMPPILNESMLAGQVWGKQIAEKVVKRLQVRGYIKEQ
jgi:hypothetical protein